MSKTKTKSFLIAIAAAMCALCLLLGTLAHGWTRAANELVKLDAYADQTIPENNAHDQEYNVFDANKKTDFGIRKPTFDADGNMTSALSGDPIGHPGANGMNIGNGISVDYGVAKLRMVYAGGGARYRYGYGVDFSNLNINLNFLDLNGRNGHLDLTFSNNYEAVSHSGLNYPGVTLAIYQDSVNYFQSALLSAHNRNAIEGLTSTNDNNNVMSFAVSADDPESYCFSIYTSKNADGSYSIQVMNKSAQIVYTIPASLESELVREDGTTNIGLNCNYGDWSDETNEFLTYVIEIKDTFRTEYENEILNPVKDALESYLEVLDETSVTTIEQADAWLAKRAAIDMSKASKLRIGDRNVMQLSARVDAANARLKELAGSAVNAYVAGRIEALNEGFVTALGDDYTAITQQSAFEELQTLYSAVSEEYRQTYAAVITCTEDEANAYSAALNAASDALARLNKHLAIYTVEHMDMSDADAIIAAKAAYAKINTDAFRESVNALNTADTHKQALLSRLTAIEAQIAEAEDMLDPVNIVDGQIANYEKAPISTIAEMRAALEVRALINDFSALEGAAEFQARVDAKDAAIEAAAWTIVEPSVTAVQALIEKGVNSYQEKLAICAAREAVANTDLLSEERKEEAQKALDDAQTLNVAFDNLLEEKGWAIYSGSTGGLATTADIAFTEKGVIFKNAGNQDAIIYTKPFDLAEGVEIVFTAKQWGYLSGDGTANGSNNSWICFSNRYQEANGSYISRTSTGAMSIMYWQCVEPSYVKGYYQSDEPVNFSEMSTIPEDARVIVTLKANDGKSRFEIETSVYAADGTELEGCYSIIFLSYNDTMKPETFQNGVYVSFSCWMDDRDRLFNEWEIESLGKVGTWEASQQPDNPDNPDNPGTDGCNSCGSASASLGLVLIALGVAVVGKRR